MRLLGRAARAKGTNAPTVGCRRFGLYRRPADVSMGSAIPLLRAARLGQNDCSGAVRDSPGERCAMGDVTTHGQISGAVIPILNVPEAPLFEVGNWLTDVSQFRDPFAHVSGKKRIFNTG